jgi:fucose 4-O-acetylase-like acetyltransferase
VPFLAVYAAWQRWVPTAVPFDFWRDFTLNRHWTPRGATTFLIIGGVASMLAGSYWLMERRRWKAPWLVTLGQTAFMLYFVHQVIEEIIVHRMLGVRFRSALAYGLATLALIVLCVYLGRVWLGLRPWIRRVPLFR